MIVSLDFDGTFTRSPQLWASVVAFFGLAGWQVITVTARRKTLENENAMRDAGVTWPIVFAYDCPKKLAAKQAGYDVDIWIDDNPHGIGDGTEDTSTKTVFQIELEHAFHTLRRGDDVSELLLRMSTVVG